MWSVATPSLQRERMCPSVIRPARQLVDDRDELDSEDHIEGAAHESQERARWALELHEGDELRSRVDRSRDRKDAQRPGLRLVACRFRGAARDIVRRGASPKPY